MPLVRKESGSAPPTAMAPAAGLASPEADIRWSAARSLAGDVTAMADLASALAGESDARVREAILSSLAHMRSPEAIHLIAVQIRSDNAGLRTAALDTLHGVPAEVAPVLADLLADPDADVRLLVCELARDQPPEIATARLCELLDNESLANVCAAAVEVLAEVATADAAPALRRCAERFAAEPFLVFAIKIALGRIDGPPDG